MKFFVRWWASVAHLVVSVKHVEAETVAHGLTLEVIVALFLLALVAYFEGQERLHELVSCIETVWRAVKDWISSLF